MSYIGDVIRNPLPNSIIFHGKIQDFPAFLGLSAKLQLIGLKHLSDEAQLTKVDQPPGGVLFGPVRGRKRTRQIACRNCEINWLVVEPYYGDNIIVRIVVIL